MGNIPLVTARESARTAIKDVRGAMASPDDFGASIGRATQQLGGSLNDVASAAMKFDEAQKKKRNDDITNEAIMAKPELDRIGLEAQRNAPADGAGMANTTRQAQLDKIDQDANAKYPNDPEARKKYKDSLLPTVAGWESKQIAGEFSQSETNARFKTSEALDATINRTRIDPTTYDENVADADRLIDQNSLIPANIKQQAKADYRSKLGTARVEAGLSKARSTDDYDALQAELETDKFRTSMTPAAYDRALDMIKTSKSQFMTAEGAKANAALGSMEARSKDKVLIPDQEMAEMAATAKNAKSPAIAIRFQEIYQQQEDLKNYGKAPPAQLRQKSEEIKGSASASGGGIGAVVSMAAQIAGVPTTTIQAILGNEYSSGDITAGRMNEPNKAGASSARGLFQFTNGTWIQTVRGNPEIFGDASSFSDSEILALRSDPMNQAKAMGALTRDNSMVLSRAGIDANANNLYMLHFLGAGGGMSFLKGMQANPNAAATSAAGADQVAANKSVFYKQNGQARSFAEVYDMFGAKMARNGSQTAVQYNRSQYIEGMASDKEKAIKDDAISTARKDGIISNTALTDENSFSLRGREAMAAANYYSVPTPDMKPFTSQESQDISRKLKEGTADDKLAILAQIQAMDKAAPGMATAALKQLGEEDSVIGHAAGLAYSGQREVAAQVIRGQDRIQNDKTLGDALGGKGDAEREFNTVVGMGLNGVKPEQRNAIFNAARGHYIETNPGVNKSFDSSAFRKSVKAVMGGNDSIANINGEPAVVPPGTTPERFERAIEGAFNDSDYVAMSPDRQAPRYSDGTLAPARDISYEGKPRFIGGGMYTIEMADGKFLVNGQKDANGNNVKYTFTPTKEAIDTAIARKNVPQPNPAVDATPTNVTAPPAAPAPQAADGTFINPQDGMRYPAPRAPIAGNRR